MVRYSPNKSLKATKEAANKIEANRISEARPLSRLSLIVRIAGVVEFGRHSPVWERGTWNYVMFHDQDSEQFMIGVRIGGHDTRWFKSSLPHNAILTMFCTGLEKAAKKIRCCISGLVAPLFQAGENYRSPSSSVTIFGKIFMGFFPTKLEVLRF